ncbi:MarR family transcriptional regulator [Paenibacillus sp. D2_2]|uniref:MarR family winged helix-turn-helix transcriptional regulator n=1 Tax=Paenibacillus sp. D2_2 TaxID=3073092 RepID=UPI00281560BC|nr:MarR family transcriptional regulator [Paenibacillus sp. D2_2]WMT43245.1 MarR family transcriptional regulator [Paenibacillus sp. D2_2]
MPKKELMLEVSGMFRQLLKNMSNELNKVCTKEYNLSFSQYQILYTLKMRGALKVSELAEARSLTPPAVTGLIDKLDAGGYVKRERAEDDRRVVYTVITEKGYNIVEKVTEDQKELIQALFDMLPEEDMQHLKRIYSSMLLKYNR